MTDPIDFDRERKRRLGAKRPPGPRRASPWIGRLLMIAMVIYALVRAWQMWGQPLL